MRILRSAAHMESEILIHGCDKDSGENKADDTQKKEKGECYSTDEDLVRAQKLYVEEKYIEAEKIFSAIIHQNPQSDAALSGRAGCFLKMGRDRLDQASRDIDSCLSINGMSSDGYCKKGLLFLQEKKIWEAKAMFKKAIELCNENKEAAMGYRKCLIMLDQDLDQARARSSAQPAVQRCLRDQKMQDTLKLMQEDPRAARRVLRESVVAREGLHTLIQSGAIMFR